MAFRRDKALESAQQHAARGDLEQAILEYQAVVEHEPGDVSTWLLLADSLKRGGQTEPALERYIHAANLLLQSGDIPQALQVFRQVLSHAPERYDVHLSTAQAFEQLRRVPEAVALYEKVASVYLRSGNTREALMLYERVADLMPREVGKRLRLAELFSREKRIDDAVVQFQRSATFLREAGRDPEFVRVAERLLYHRQVDTVIRELVEVYLELGQPRRALMKLNELLQRKHTDTEGLELLADTFVRLGKTDKAISVVRELVKIQRKGGPEELRQAVRVLGKAVAWAPGDVDLAALHAELKTALPPEPEIAEPETGEEEYEELEEFEEFEELDDFEEVDESPAPAPPRPPPARSAEPPARSAGPAARLEAVDHAGERARAAAEVGDAVPVARARSLTQEVISEGTQAHTDEGEFDFDKQLEEVRVLMKYHLFEHALGHVEQILGPAPRHLQALELRADILAGLERPAEAADARVELAELLVDGDPQRATEQLEIVQSLAPDHARAAVLRRAWADLSGVEPEPQPKPRPKLRVEPEPKVALPFSDEVDGYDDDPLSALDLDDDLLGPIEASDSLVAEVDLDLVAEMRRGIHTEELREPDREPEASPDLSAASEGSGSIDIASADPSLANELSKLAGDSDFSISVASDPEPEIPEESNYEDRFGLGDDESDEDGFSFGSDDSPFGDEGDVAEQGGVARPVVGRVGVEEPEPEPASEPEPTPEPASEPPGEVSELDFASALLDDDDDDAFQPEPERAPEPEPERAPEPAPEPEPAGTDWPDLSGELDELDFYFDNDLEEDARAAYGDLMELYPGHPELAKIAHRFPDAAGEVVDAAEPLLDLEDEDDDDDFLAGIFDDVAPGPRKEREVQIQTRDVEGADAGDHFDLGTAYREMGLIEKAIAEYETAAKDPRWEAKSLVQMGVLRHQLGDLEAALVHFAGAVSQARTKDERCQANYELAMVHLDGGDEDAARLALECVDPGFRDRDTQLALLI